MIERGKNVLTRLHLGANEILQMAGRVHGRVEGGRVFILSDRDIDFSAPANRARIPACRRLRRVALTCADLGVRADDLEPVPLDRRAYRDAVSRLEERGIIENGRLSQYGKLVEALPVTARGRVGRQRRRRSRALPGGHELDRVSASHDAVEDRDLEGLIVPGSDHLGVQRLRRGVRERRLYG